MTIRELYPFWPETHDEIIERLKFLKPERWDYKPAHIDSGSIRQVVVRMARHERLWTEQVILGKIPSDISGGQNVPTDDLISELVSARALTEHFLRSRVPDSLREVREAPPDPETNETERNVPISWIIWRILEFELISWGEIKMRLQD